MNKVWVGADVLSRLRGEIVSGELAPGQKLRFVELQGRYASSVGTLREALTYLAAEGLVQADAGKGFAVSPISADDLRDIVELRVWLERMAIESAIAHGDSEWEAQIVAAYHRLSRIEGLPAADRAPRELEWADIHQRFHRALVSACTSPWTLRFHATLFERAHRYRMLARHMRGSGRNSGAEHRAIMEAVLDRDVAEAVRHSERHIRDTAAVVLSGLTAAGEKA